MESQDNCKYISGIILTKWLIICSDNMSFFSLLSYVYFLLFYYQFINCAKDNIRWISCKYLTVKYSKLVANLLKIFEYCKITVPI